MSDERFYEVVIVKSVTGIIRVSAGDRTSEDESLEDVARELATWDEGWTKGSREEQTDSIEIIDITAQHQARLAKDTRP